MKRLWVTLAVAGLLACGGQDTATTTGGTEADAPPPVSAQTGSAPAAPSAPESPAAPAAAAPEQDENTKSCLQLVADAQYTQAVPVCLAALQANPANQQVKDALAKAQAEAGQMAGAAAGAASEAQAGAEAAAGAAVDDATGKASGAVSDALKPKL